MKYAIALSFPGISLWQTDLNIVDPLIFTCLQTAVFLLSMCQI